MNDLRDLLHDAVVDVEPSDRIADLRARTADPVRAAARPWFRAAGATVLATAAAVAVVAVVSDGSDDPDHHHDMAMDPPASTQLVAAYFIGDSAEGPRLFREFDQVPVGDPLQAALDRIERPANDPDYRTPWTADSFGRVTQEADGIHVEVRPDELGNELAVQQVVYTLQAAAGEQLPVWLSRQGQRGTARVTAAPQPDVLHPVSISDPAEGNAYAGSFTARGRVRSTERTLDWRVVLGEHTIVASGTATIEPAKGSFSPWTAEIDLSSLTPGTYSFVVSTSDVIAAYGDTFTDTRTINVR